MLVVDDGHRTTRLAGSREDTRSALTASERKSSVARRAMEASSSTTEASVAMESDGVDMREESRSDAKRRRRDENRAEPSASSQN